MSGRTLVLCALVITGCAANGPHAGNGDHSDVGAVVDVIANRYLAETPIAGLVVTVARDGEIVHDAGYGLARRSPDVAAGPSVPFEYFSVSIPVTAVLLLKLAERGLLDLDAPAGKYVQGLPAHYAAATLRQLLRHSAGGVETLIDEFDPEPRFARAPSRAALLEWLSGVTVVARPDETWIYDSWGFVVAGLAAEDAAGRGFGELIRTEMAQPLSLGNFAWCPELASTRAQGYMLVDEALAPIPAIDFGWFGGAGALCGTAGDLARWWLAVRSGQVIAPTSLQEWTTPVALERNGVRADFGYGLAVRLGDYGGHTKIGHTGDGAGGTSILAEYPDDRLLIVVATNTAGAKVPHALEIEAAIARELLDIPQATPPTVSIPPEALATVPGLYRSTEGVFCVQAHDDALHVSTDEEQAVELRYVGGGHFLRPGDTDSIEYFLGWPDHTEWFGYAWYGLPMDLAAKVSDTCP